MKQVELVKVYAAVPDEGILLIDAVRKEDGSIWFVPEWLDGYPTEGFSQPARMIRPLWAQFGKMGEHLLLQGTLPKDALSKESLQGYEVVLMPNLFVEIGPPGTAH
jgi:hypothetical protein